jgi:ribosome biogenesis GTPase
MTALTGMIYRSTGGFYSVLLSETEREVECRARGLFRKDGIKPCVGDRAVVSINGDGSGNVDEILPRKSLLGRPPLANLDDMALVLSVTDPVPNLLVTDKLLAILEYKGIEPLIAITKSDLDDPEPLRELYEGAGYAVFVVGKNSDEGIAALTERLRGRFSAFSGNSGVGKSSLLNRVDPRLGLAVGDTSKKLGRGKHTTRHVEAYALPGGGFVADTPGFTSLDLLQSGDITAADLADCFREFTPHIGSCRFLDCTHTVEKGCAVLAAVASGEIAPSRHQSYVQLHGELKEVPAWERR